MFIVKEINNPNDFDSIEKQWCELSEKDSDHSVFQTFDYARTWWKIYADKKDLRLLLIKKHQPNKVVAIIPFYIRKHYGFKIFQLIADTHSDYSHFLTLLNAEELSEALGKYLAHNRSWDVLVQYGVIEGSSTDSVFSRLKRKKFITYLQNSVKAPKMELLGNWQSFYENLDKRIRKDTERQLRRLASLGKIRLVEINGKDINPDLEIFFRMHQQRWKEKNGGSIFDDEGNRRFYREVAQKLGGRGQLAFFKLMIDEAILAMHFGFKYKRRFYYYLPTFNIEYAKFSVGRVLILELIKKCFQEKFESFDFMAGEEAYKYLFANREANLLNVYIINRRLKGCIYNFLKFKLRPFLMNKSKC